MFIIFFNLKLVLEDKLPLTNQNHVTFFSPFSENHFHLAMSLQNSDLMGHEGDNNDC